MSIIQITDFVKRGKLLLPTQSKGKPNLEALLDNLYSKEVQEIENVIFQLLDITDIDLSVVQQLDNLGIVVGQRRVGLTDALLRIFLKARIGANVSQGSIEDLISIWKLIVSPGVVELFENFPAEVSLYTDIPLDDALVIDAFNLMKKVPAAGVQLGFTAVFFDTPFGFAEGSIIVDGFGNLLSQRTNTSVATNKLIDSGATFITDGITAGPPVPIAYNTSDETDAKVVSVDSEIQLTLDADIFTGTPKDYYVNENVGGKLGYIQGS